MTCSASSQQILLLYVFITPKKKISTYDVYVSLTYVISAKALWPHFMVLRKEIMDNLVLGDMEFLLLQKLHLCLSLSGPCKIYYQFQVSGMKTTVHTVLKQYELVLKRIILCRRSPWITSSVPCTRFSLFQRSQCQIWMFTWQVYVYVGGTKTVRHGLTNW